MAAANSRIELHYFSDQSDIRLAHQGDSSSEFEARTRVALFVRTTEAGWCEVQCRAVKSFVDDAALHRSRKQQKYTGIVAVLMRWQRKQTTPDADSNRRQAAS